MINPWYCWNFNVFLHFPSLHSPHFQFYCLGISGSSAKSGNDGHSKQYSDSSWYNTTGQLSRGGSSGIASLSPSSSSAGTISPPNLKQGQINGCSNSISVITSKANQQLNNNQDQQKYFIQQRKKSSVTRPTEAPPAPPKAYAIYSDLNLKKFHIY